MIQHILKVILDFRKYNSEPCVQVLKFFIIFLKILLAIQQTLASQTPRIIGTAAKSIVCHTAVLSVVTQRSSTQWGGALRDDTKNRKALQQTTKSKAKINQRCLTDINSRCYGLSLMRTLTQGPYSLFTRETENSVDNHSFFL